MELHRASLGVNLPPLMKTPAISAVVICLLLCGGCRSAYYSAWEKVGVYKRDLLKKKVVAARDDQKAAGDRRNTYVAIIGGERKSPVRDRNVTRGDDIARSIGQVDELIAVDAGCRNRQAGARRNAAHVGPVVVYVVAIVAVDLEAGRRGAAAATSAGVPEAHNRLCPDLRSRLQAENRVVKAGLIRESCRGAGRDDVIRL